MSISTLVRPDEPILTDVPVTEDPVQAMIDAFMSVPLGPVELPTGPVSDQFLANLARKAAGEVEMRGWTRYKLMNCAGQVCAMGAVTFALRDDLAAWWDSRDEYAERASQVVELLGVRFANWLGAQYGVPSWNDGHQHTASRIPSPQSAADVAAAFRGFADALLAGEA